VGLRLAPNVDPARAAADVSLLGGGTVVSMAAPSNSRRSSFNSIATSLTFSQCGGQGFDHPLLHQNPFILNYLQDRSKELEFPNDQYVTKFFCMKPRLPLVRSPEESIS